MTLTSLFWLILAIVGVGTMIYWILGKNSKGKSRRLSSGRLPAGNLRGLDRKLAHLAGSPNTAQRLVQQLVAKYPGKPAHWYYEKAIYDLERDRRV